MVIENKKAKSFTTHWNVGTGNDQHISCTHHKRRKINYFTPVNCWVAWKISHNLDGYTCMADLLCESWVKNKQMYADFPFTFMVIQPDHRNTLRQMRNLRLANHLPVVLLKVTELSEAFLAVRAGVGFHSSVDADMLGQVAWVGEWLRTMGTFVRLWLCVVPKKSRQAGERKKGTEL